MLRFSRVWALGASCLSVCVANGQVPQFVAHGVFEAYLSSQPGTKGLTYSSSWFEVEGRYRDRYGITVSKGMYPGGNSFDEACLRYDDPKGPVVRAGRIRSQFGFADWNELFYNGINHLPFMRITSLGEGLSLSRNDSGIEVTAGSPALQIQANWIDTDMGEQQILPHRMDHSSIRLQTNQGPVIVGLNLLTSLVRHRDTYGLDFRYTQPHWQIRAEAARGDERDGASGGYYVDAFYRLPSLVRTQAVARVEGIRSYDAPGASNLNTVGIRQIFSKSLTASINFGWGSGDAAEQSNAKGWSLLGIYQIHF